MTAYPTDRKIASTAKLQSGALSFFSNVSASGGFGTIGGLCSVEDVSIGDETLFPLSTNNRNSWVQYIREVKELEWSISYDFDDGSGTTETASESGTNIFMPQGYSASSVPNPPGLEHRRRALGSGRTPGLTLNDFSGRRNLFISDAVTETLPGGTINKKDLEIFFVIFGDTASSTNRTENVAHNPATGAYYPRFYLVIHPGNKTIQSFGSLFGGSYEEVGTVSVEDLGSCPIYSDVEGITCTFTATIASRFSDP